MGLTAEQRQQLKETFDDIDTDKSGALSREELTRVMNMFSNRRKPSQRQVDRVFRAADVNGDGSISFEEFITAMEKVQLSQDEEWQAGFRAFDTDHSGSIEPKEFIEACKNLGITLCQTDIQVLMEEFDKDGDQKINFDEFAALLRSLDSV
jgi:Ca2+-binding EF-hand superfamily protein